MQYSILLLLHIIAGTIALVSGGIAFTTHKGKGWHKNSGTFFFYAMLTAGFSALIMCLLKPNPFLFIVGIFSLYLTLTGYRSIRTYSTVHTDRVIWGLTLLGTGLFLFMNFQAAPSSLTPVLVVFSFILIGMLLSDFRELRLNSRSNGKNIRKHISRMGGAYIATITAFLVTNFETEPTYLLWFLPTAAGTPAIIYFQYRFSGRQDRRSKKTEPERKA